MASTNPLNVQMEEIEKFALSLFEEIGSVGDAHLEVCQRTADKFYLWEDNASGGQSFPLWLSFVVQGWGRDGGYLF